MSDARTDDFQRWQRLLERPIDFVDPAALRACLPRALNDEHCAALYAAPRFESRLTEQLMAHFGLQPLARLSPPAPEDLDVLLLSAEDFARLPRRCGALWHASTLSREIRGDVVKQLRSALGDDVFELALAHRSLGGALDLLRTPADLLAAMDRDGLDLVMFWLRQQPAALRDWLRVRLPTLDEGHPRTPASASDPLHSANGLSIVRRAAASLNPSAAQVA